MKTRNIIENAKGNVLQGCKKHGLEAYFQIKKFEKNPKWAKSMVYVWFKDKVRGDEKLWCRILKGDLKKGIGIIDNEPFNVIQFKLGDKIRYQTDSTGITWKVAKA